MKNALWLIIALTLAGCVSVGRKLDETKVAQIHNGATSSEVKNLIGSPDHVMRDGIGNMSWSYYHVSSTAKPASFIPVVGLFAGGADTHSSMLILFFGPTGVVTNMLTSASSTEVGNGGLRSAGKPSEDVTVGKRPR